QSQIFSKTHLGKIFREKHAIIDIGGGLRLLSDKGNRRTSEHQWLREYLDKVDYKILDPVPDYNPDIVGDIHHLPLQDESVDAIICVSVLEHVENPLQAVAEIRRVLKKGGYCFIYVPFLYYYHAERGYYKDYWRFSEDAVRLLAKNFTSVVLQNTRGALETWLKISPLGRVGFLMAAARLADNFFKKTQSKQTSGYQAFLVK
ncbi:MAG: class I SAM-dependent methyltransferase, partial [Patescibacteria group bacterium]